jgi:DNA-binding NtrC family response regulator
MMAEIFTLPDSARRVLIACDDSSIAESLQTTFQKAGFESEITTSISRCCDRARSGRFPVVVSNPVLSDGSWKRLVDIDIHCDLAFEIVLLAHAFDVAEWMEVLDDGALDVIDTSFELPRASEIVKRAIWVACLRGFRPPVHSPTQDPTTSLSPRAG